VDLNKLTLGDKLAAGGGIAFVLFAIILDWHRVCFAGFCTGLSVFSGEGEAVPVLGLLAFLLGLAVTVVVLLRKLTTVELPDLPIPWKDAIFYAAAATAGLLVLKLILQFDFIGFGAWLMIIASGVMAYGGFLIRGENEDAVAGPGAAPPQPF
jgi:hypothetical protein